MTKRKAREAQAAWNEALIDGRIVRYNLIIGRGKIVNVGGSFRSFPTSEDAVKFAASLSPEFEAKVVAISDAARPNRLQRKGTDSG
jgi:hypothetical protein